MAGRDGIQRLLEGVVVLREVRDKLDATNQPVDVICSVEEDWSVAEVVEWLSGLGIALREPHTDYYVFATLQDAKQGDRVERAANKAIAAAKAARNSGDKAGPASRGCCIGHVWLDKKINTCVEESQKTINAKAARQLFEANGKGIHWAVLDTGIDMGHKWFAKTCDPQRRRDFTGTGVAFDGTHGTHVAGILARIAPEVVLYDFKVLGKNGGSSSMIIRAMHEVRRINFEARKTIIHGVNMSLGGPVPIPSYGCGWSPECQEANRLVNAGVVVCAAAGNDGHKTLATINNSKKLEYFSTYVDLGIPDPGNAEEVITVGSTHKLYPHSYGPSFFSSKGPTGDGRRKPDCLAPGEKILSAKAKTKGALLELDGTSMATPHVSGAIAVFLSAKPEFKGKAREVKRILLESCTDLRRDPYFQGAGLVDLLRMLQSV